MKKEYSTEIEKEAWDLTIKPKTGFFDLRIQEIWHYKDLVFLLVKRDWDAAHKQTILGPFWTIAQPLFMTIIFSLIFNKIGKISTNAVPPSLFYMCGLLPWGLFNTIFTKSSTTLSSNMSLFGKVYFPRLVVPIANVLSSLITFAINFGVFIAFLIIAMTTGFKPDLHLFSLALPFLILITIMFSVGTGLIISSLTVKYRDLNFLVTFGIQLFMYATPIIFPLSAVPPKYQFIILLNPLAGIVEGFRIALLGSGDLPFGLLIYSIVFSIILLVFGILLFNKTEKTFIDTI